MMSLRNRGYDRLTVTYSIGRMVAEDAPTMLRAALSDYLLSPHGQSARLVRSRSGRSWKRITADQAAALAAESVVELPGSLDRSEIVAHGVSARFASGLPVRIFVNNGQATFAFPHALFDGTGATTSVDRVLARIDASRSGSGDEVIRPVEVRPLRTAMAKLEISGLTGVRAARRVFRDLHSTTETEYQLGETLTKEESLVATSMVNVVLDHATLDAIAAAREHLPDGRKPARAPVSIKVASIVMRALAEVNASGKDFRVVLPIDARRFATKGTEVEGNFSPSVPIGRLMTSDWSATEILRVVGAAIKAGTPVTWLLASLLVTVKGQLQHPFTFDRPLAETPRVPFEIHLSMPSITVTLPDALFRDSTEIFVGGAPAHADLPLGVWVELSPLDDTVHVTVRDETGLFDTDAFPAALAARVQSFTTTALPQ